MELKAYLQNTHTSCISDRTYDDFRSPVKDELLTVCVVDPVVCTGGKCKCKYISNPLDLSIT